MPDLVPARKALYYDGREYQPGQRFEATPVDAAWLKKTGRAIDPPQSTPAAPVGHVATTRAPELDLQPEAPASDTVEPSPESPRGRFRRRDLRAED